MEDFYYGVEGAGISYANAKLRSNAAGIQICCHQEIWLTHMTSEKNNTERFEVSSPFTTGFLSTPLKQEQYQFTVEAKSFLLTYVRFEENYLQLLYALQNFEKFLTDSAVDHSLFPVREFDQVQNSRVRANIYVGGFLNAVTGFRDQFPNKREFKAVHKEFQGQWDKSKLESRAFSFGERLRNYAQHQSHPVTSITSGGSWDKERTYRESNVTVYADTSDVASERISSEERADYISEFGKRTDIALIIRELAGHIGEMVKVSRNSLKSNFDEAVERYHSTLDIGRQIDSEAVIFRITKLHDNIEVESFDLFDDFLDRAKGLRRNFASTKNHQHFVSSRARGHLFE